MNDVDWIRYLAQKIAGAGRDRFLLITAGAEVNNQWK
jgi:hypothetical protein